MKIPSAARYHYATNKAYEFLLRYVHTLPFNTLDYILQNGWAISTYTHYADTLGCSVDDIATCYKSKDAYTIYNRRNYCIAFNDTVRSKRRIYFTLMHEIAHIYLNHFVDFEKTSIFENSLSLPEYRTLENEANCFARNVLMPVSVIMETGIDPYKTERIFKVGSKAAATRHQFLDSDRHWITDQHYRLSLTKYDSYVKMCKNVRVCAVCGALFIADSYFCAACGSSED